MLVYPRLLELSRLFKAPLHTQSVKLPARDRLASPTLRRDFCPRPIYVSSNPSLQPHYHRLSPLTTRCWASHWRTKKIRDLYRQLTTTSNLCPSRVEHRSTSHHDLRLCIPMWYMHTNCLRNKDTVLHKIFHCICLPLLTDIWFSLSIFWIHYCLPVVWRIPAVGRCAGCGDSNDTWWVWPVQMWTLPAEVRTENKHQTH